MLPTLLLVDDDPLIADALAFVLGRDYQVHIASQRPEAVEWLRSGGGRPDIALVDLGLPPATHTPDEGFRLIAELLAHQPDLRILVLSGQNDEANARQARALGALDFLAKPCPPEVLLKALNAAQTLPKTVVPEGHSLESVLVGTSPALDALRAQVRQFAPAPFPVLISGESGCGKELVARGLHECSDRAAQPFVTVNCAAIAETLFEAALFGHARGAYTGAAQARAGFFEEADRGTLFLDEIGEMPLDMQAKLLRTLENGEFVRVGETQARYTKARIVAATNRDLAEAVQAGQFRADLFYRLSVLTIIVAPLRDRKADKLALWQHYSQIFAAQMRAMACQLSEEAAAVWLAYGFPGNVRELRNIVIRLQTKYPGAQISAEQMQAELTLGKPQPEAGASLHRLDLLARQALDLPGFELDDSLKAWEGALIRVAIERTHGNMSATARLLNLNRTTLYSRMETLGIKLGSEF